MTLAPLEFGVGARYSLAIMADDYAEKIISIITEVDSSKLREKTTDVSTYVGGDEADLHQYFIDIATKLAELADHSTITLQLSRGCPGEVSCDIPNGAGARAVSLPELVKVGKYATADWCLYPLGQSTENDEQNYMQAIYQAIEQVKAAGVFEGSAHFATRLQGDVGEIISAVFRAWITLGAALQHVVTHLNISLNSPGHKS